MSEFLSATNAAPGSLAKNSQTVGKPSYNVEVNIMCFIFMWTYKPAVHCKISITTLDKPIKQLLEIYKQFGFNYVV